MRISDVTRMGFGNLGRRKGRTVLTLVGVVIGVAALVLLVALGIGLKLEILKIFQTEDELVTIHVMRARPDAGKKGRTGFPTMGMLGPTVPMTEKDVEELKRLPAVESVSPNLSLVLFAKLGDVSLGPPVAIDGATDGDVEKLRSRLVEGRPWSAGERGCLVPSRMLEVRSELRPADVIGRSIVFMGNDDDVEAGPRTYTITGVVNSEKLGMRGGTCFVPWESGVALRELTGGGLLGGAMKKGTYQEVRVRVKSPELMSDVTKQLKNLNYATFTVADIIGMIDTFFLVVEGFMACIGAIGVIVALFGIANTMAMSVLERTREIGVMKALGARNRDVRRVFLIEAASIGVIGGFAGLGLGMLASVLLGWIARTAMDIPADVTLFHVSPLLAAGAVLFALIVSVAAGMVPALRASRLDPVKALRYE